MKKQIAQSVIYFKMKNEFIKAVRSKGINRRIEIVLLKNEKEYFYIIKTKRLLDVKTRNIITTENIFGIETFHIMSELMTTFFTKDSEIINKHLLRDLNNIVKHNVSIILK